MPTDAIVLVLAIAIDTVFGDPPNAFHPVAWFGRGASSVVARLPTVGRAAPFAAGAALVLFSVSIAVGIGLGIDAVASRLSLPAAILVRAVGLKSCFALRGLLDAARELVVAHDERGIDAARERLAWLCSRDARALDSSGLANGAIESLAENLSDSVVAPLLYFAIFGLPGAFAYRAVNTLDAMVGYRGRFEWLGKSAARIDDLLNLVPARLTAFVVGIAGASQRLDVRSGARVYLADRRRTESPNAGHPMAMTAGLLGLRLDKPEAYVLGGSLRAPTLADVGPAIALVRAAGAVAVFLFVSWELLGG